MIARIVELADHLRVTHDAIVDEWRRRCREDEKILAANKLTRHEFENNITAALQELRVSLLRSTEAKTRDQLLEDVGEHGHHRWKQGFDLRELIRDWGVLNCVLVARISEFFRVRGESETQHAREAQDRLARFMLEATSSSVRRYDELRRAEAASMAKDVSFARDQLERVTTARGQLLREAAHDLRGGLSAISMASNVLELGDKADDPAVQVIRRNVVAVNELLSSLLDLARLEAGAEALHIAELDAATLLRELVEEHALTAERKGLALEVEGPERLVVRSDRAKLRRVAQNLLINALNYTKRGAVKLSFRREPERWILYVSDTGPGIQELIGTPLAAAFDETEGVEGDDQPGPEDRLHVYAGEGIGLSIVKKLCAMLDAGITLDSVIGRGTTFTLTFPIEYVPVPEV